MKNVFSFVACIIIGLALLLYRADYSDMKQRSPALKVTVWDAFGYYLYLPAIIKYHDFKELKWIPEIDKKYAVSGGDGWPAQKADNGNYVFKYLGGVALMEVPFYFIGDFMAKHSKYPPDGFSPPYQYALGFGVLIYCILGIFLLRKLLLKYFGDATTAVTLVMVCLATNFIQYASIDNGQSHGYIFPLYVLVLYSTYKWHQKPHLGWAILTGYVVGLATICRPTEAIMLFIPLLWNTHNKVVAHEKWLTVKQNSGQIIWASVAGFIGVLPQLVYWKMASGSFVYDVGSKWEFLSPHFRVLFGWEKGWFIYTPVTVLFIVGMFFMKSFPFRKSVAWFCFLNIYIIIAWHDWRYGGSYSSRALSQSYPVFALPFAALVDRINIKKWRLLFYILCVYLLIVNFFQIYQYNSSILLYDGMNREYYGRIYLNPNPSPMDMSLLDNDEVINNEAAYNKNILISSDRSFDVRSSANSPGLLYQTDLNVAQKPNGISWLKVGCSINASGFLWPNFLNAELQNGDSVKHTKVRLYNAISRDDKTNDYAFYMSIPKYFARSHLKIYISSGSDFAGMVRKVKVTVLEK